VGLGGAKGQKHPGFYRLGICKRLLFRSRTCSSTRGMKAGESTRVKAGERGIMKKTLKNLFKNTRV